MENKSNRIKVWTILAVLFLAIALAEAFFLLDTTPKTDWTDFAKSCTIEFFCSLIAVVIILLGFDVFKNFTKKEKGAVEFYAFYGNVQWSEFIPKAKTILIKAIYFEKHFTIQHNYYKTFFLNGGKLKILLPDYNNAELINDYLPSFPEFQAKDLIEKIKNTEKEIIKKIYLQYATPAALVEIGFSNSKFSNFNYMIDNKFIFFSVFEYLKKPFTPAKSPTFLVKNMEVSDPEHDAEYWHKEFDYLWKQAKIKTKDDYIETPIGR